MDPWVLMAEPGPSKGQGHLTAWLLPPGEPLEKGSPAEKRIQSGDQLQNKYTKPAACPTPQNNYNNIC